MRPVIVHRRRVAARYRNGEDGYILLGVLILLFLFVLAMGIAAPVVAKSIQQDKDEEAVQRGKQYKRALRLYYKKFNTYPASIDLLENTNNIRFLRKRYLDPITGKDDWRLIHVGEAKVPVLGFFGQPLQGGVSSVTTGLAGNGTGGIGNGSTIGGTAGGSGDASGGSGSGGSTDGSGAPQAPVGVLPGMSSAGSPAGAAGTGLPGGTTAGGTSGSSTTGSTFGNDGTAGPIVGVGIPVDKKSLVVYHKQDTYKKWEFTYDPIEEQMYSGSGGIPGASPAGGTGTGTGTPGFGGATTGNNPFGGSSTGNGPVSNPIGGGISQPSTGNSGSSSSSPN